MLLDLAYIYLYSAACAIYLPLPSEAPMFLFPGVPRVLVLLVCALGKGSGAYLVFAFGHRFRDSRTFQALSNASAALMKAIHVIQLWNWLSKRIESLVIRYGIWGFLLAMAIPSAPMRSAIYAASLVKIDGLRLTIAVMIGTIIRNSLVYWGYLGLHSLIR